MKRWQVSLAIFVFILFFLVWGQIRTNMATAQTIGIRKPEKTYTIRILKKIGEVLSNQRLIMQELDEIKRIIKK